jgi:hypothetical protein
LLKLLERDIRRRRLAVKVQPVRVRVFLPFWGCELSFAVVDDCASLGRDARSVLAHHHGA